MNAPDSEEPSTWDWVSGIFQVIFGVLFTLIGGGCTTAWVYSFISMLINPSPYGGGIGNPLGWLMLAISVSFLIGSLQLVRNGLKKMGLRD